MDKHDVTEIIMKFGVDKNHCANIKEKFFQGIIDKVLDSFADGLENQELELETIHPAILISIICTNIIMNLFYNTAHAENNEKRAEMLNSLLMQIVCMCKESMDILVKKDEIQHH